MNQAAMDNDTTVEVTPEDRELAAFIAGCNKFAFTGQMYREGQLDDDPIIQAISASRAELVVALREAFPKHIGRLNLGEKLSCDHYCGGSHEMPDGHPVYWQGRGGEYPDDIEGFCLACAIVNAESEAGWCECSVKEARHQSGRTGAGEALEERAAIVAWLRKLAGPLPKGVLNGEVWIVNRAADCIEKGQHIEQDDDQ